VGDFGGFFNERNMRRTFDDHQTGTGDGPVQGFSTRERG
jgi:hypothetical protein